MAQRTQTERRKAVKWTQRVRSVCGEFWLSVADVRAAFTRVNAAAVWAALLFACSTPTASKTAEGDANPADAAPDVAATVDADVAAPDVPAVDVAPDADAADSAEDAADAADTVDAAVDATAGTDAEVDSGEDVAADAAPDVADADGADAPDAPDVVDALADAVDVQDAVDAPDVADVDLCLGVTCTDTICTGFSCDPGTGKCVGKAKPDGTACDDGKKCTENDGCASGLCKGTLKACDDGNPCTNDSCSAALGCSNTVVKAGSSCDDGDACTALDACVGIQCKGTAALFSHDLSGSALHALGITTDGRFGAGTLAGPMAGPAATSAFWLVQFNGAGNAMWSLTYGSATSGDARAVLPVVGGAIAAGINAENGPSDTDGWLLAVDGAGKTLWSKTFGGKGKDAFNGLTADGTGYVAAGQTTGGAASGWLVRVDSAGAKTWSATVDGGSDATFNAVAATASGFVAVGSVATTKSGTDGWLVRVDAKGNTLWQRTYGGSADDTLQGVLVLADGFLLAGTTASQGAGSSDFWLIRTDAQGNVVWQRMYGGVEADDLRSVVASGSDWIVSGNSTNQGVSSARVLRTDSWGNVVTDVSFADLHSPGAAIDGSSIWLGGDNGGVARLMRTDLWGNASCAASGSCLATSDGCADGNPCTTDLCDANHSGCWHGKMPETAPCSSGDACVIAQTCTAGSCGGGGEKLSSTTTQDASANAITKAAGGFVVAGRAWQNAGGKWTSAPRGVRVGALGPVWDKTYPLGGSDESANAVAATASGFVFVGTTDAGAFAIHTDSDGALVSSPVYGGTGAQGRGVAVQVQGLAIAGAKPIVGHGSDAMLVRTDADGAQAWLQTYGDVADDRANGVVAVSGGFALAGATGGDAWLIRTDDSGSMVWSKAYGGEGDDSAAAVLADADGFTLAGTTSSYGAGQTDMWLIRTDASGNALWSRTYGGSGKEVANALTATPNGYALAGSSDTGGAHGLLVRTHGNGVVVWTSESSAWLSLNAIAALPDGFAVTGDVPTATGFACAVARTDDFGTATCAGSGACATTAPASCDDGNACTADLCDAAHGGCWHTPLADATACGYGALCAASVCACAPGYVSIDTGGGAICAADGPVWGSAPATSANFFDNGDGTVSDFATGLMWRQADPAGTAGTWQAANSACTALQLGGQADWRLPTAAELATLIDFSAASPATANVLQTNVDKAYWSATAQAGNAGSFWTVRFVDGAEQTALASSTQHFRCVRGTTASHIGARFTATADTVADSWTALTWQRTANSGTQSVSGAQATCSSLTLGGQSGWRLPTVVELRSLVDRSQSSPAMDMQAFPSAPASAFWSLTSSAAAPGLAWSVAFIDGVSQTASATDALAVRCVR